MAYCRFSPESDLYVYEDVYGGYTLVTKSSYRENFSTRQELLDKMLELADRGLKVPHRALVNITLELGLPENQADEVFL